MYDELIKRLIETSIDFGESDHVSVMMIEAADAIEELQRRKHGKWITHSTAYEYCSECENIFSISSLFLVGGNNEPKYFPECGARMVGDNV